ncbi:hypothetical protein EZS27_009852 [termite gut metagenome]|uniref:Lipocalin-like domain-containing protein n=1 Tax=termite gut metagenome TaxID=433724 RepID=A0A5J4S9M2_9ZZZZ
MKRLLYGAAFVFAITLLFTSCTPEDESFDELLLPGVWQAGTFHYKYNSNHSGTTWDTSDNVTESEAQEFTWTLSGSTLTQLHIIVEVVLPETRATVPKVYTVTKLTETSLIYKDDFSKSWSFTKVR